MSRHPRIVSEGRRTARALGLALASLTVVSCSSLMPKTDPTRPTALMQETGVVMSPIEMRQRVDDMVPPVLASIRQTLDHVRAESDDPSVKRRALLLKIDTIPVVYRAAFQSDPLAAALDLWLLSYQMEHCMDVGTGPCDLGEWQAEAREQSRIQREQFEEKLGQAARNAEVFNEFKVRMREMAERHPLTEEGAIARRHTATVEVAQALGAESRDAFSVIGDFSITLTDLTSRLNTYIGDAGRLGRWHAELLVQDLKASPEVQATLAQVGDVTEDVARLEASVASIEETLGPEGMALLVARLEALIQQERGLVLSDVDRQRSVTLEYLSAEREVVLAAIDAQRVAVMAQINQERVDTLGEIDVLGAGLLDEAAGQAFRVVDHLIWRLAQLLLVMMLVGAFLTWLVLKTGGVATLMDRRG